MKTANDLISRLLGSKVSFIEFMKTMWFRWFARSWGQQSTDHRKQRRHVQVYYHSAEAMP